MDQTTSDPRIEPWRRSRERKNRPSGAEPRSHLRQSLDGTRWCRLMAHGSGWSVICVTPGKVWVKTVHRWGDARQAWRTMCRLHIHEG